MASATQTPAIDLLKIDVEKSELDVLLGIEDGDWHKIRQDVIELHDVDDQVRAVAAIFRGNGYTRRVMEHGFVLTSSNTLIFLPRVELPHRILLPGDQYSRS